MASDPQPPTVLMLQLVDDQAETLLGFQTQRLMAVSDV
jgi:hypothetical protein